MKQRLGGILVAALGATLLTGGLSAGSGITVGETTPCTAGIGFTPTCPTGTITFNETSTTVQRPSPSPTVTESPGGIRRDVPASEPTSPPTPPQSWTVTITPENCSLPSDEDSDTVTVDNNGSGTSDPLFIYSDDSHSTQCEYDYTETPVSGWVASYNPEPPQTIPDQTQTPSTRKGRARPAAASSGNLNVALTNTAYYAKPTPTPSTSPTHTHHPSPSPSASPSTAASSSVASPSPSAKVLGEQQTLPDTGAHHVGAMAWIGGLLLLVGIGLVAAPSIAGRRRRRRT